jgi:hypothetical protein
MVLGASHRLESSLQLLSKSGNGRKTREARINQLELPGGGGDAPIDDEEEEKSC